jgi:hypothetical protein
VLGNGISMHRLGPKRLQDHHFQGPRKEVAVLRVFRHTATVKLVVNAYPDSADAYGSLSDAYLADGEKDLARQTAEKALTLLDSHAVPASSWSDTEERRKLIRDGAQDNLKQLGAAR